MVCQTLREEFRLKHLRHNHPNDRVFYCCMWRWPRPVFVILRFALALYTTYGLIHLIVNHYLYVVNEDNTTTSNSSNGDDDFRIPLFAYFTVWSYIVLMLHLVFAAVLSVVFYGNAKVDDMSEKCNFGYERQSQNQTVLLDSKKLSKSDAGAETRHTNGSSRNQSHASTKLSAENPGYDFTSGNDKTQQNGKSSTNKEVKVAVSNDSGLAHSTYESFSRTDSFLEGPSTKWYFKVSWCLSYIISSAAPIVTIIFFVALYPNMEASKQAGLDLQDTNVHALNLVFVVVDHMISARPVRLLHLVSPLLYGLIYIIFSIIYWSVDHKNHIIYPGVLDWNNPGVAVGTSIGLAVIAIPLLQLAYFGVYQLKNAIHKKLYGVPFDGSVY